MRYRNVSISAPSNNKSDEKFSKSDVILNGTKPFSHGAVNWIAKHAMRGSLIHHNYVSKVQKNFTLITRNFNRNQKFSSQAATLGCNFVICLSEIGYGSTGKSEISWDNRQHHFSCVLELLGFRFPCQYQWEHFPDFQIRMKFNFCCRNPCATLPWTHKSLENYVPWVYKHRNP